MRKLFKSLQAKYMLIICVALILFQAVYLGSAILFTSITQEMDAPVPDFTEVERSWHAAAKALDGDLQQAVQQLYESWSVKYPEAAMFWVNGEGELQSSWNMERELPTYWTSLNTAQFIKSSYGNDPFTVVAFVTEEQQGFVVIELPRQLFRAPINNLYDNYGYLIIITIIVILIFFIVISYMFFRSIRKRLLALQEAMNIRDVDSLPIAIEISKPDEIGQLEQAFNHMVIELKQSRAREVEDEQVRRQLIANLSHDIRTPLTKIRANAYTLSRHELPTEVATTANALEVSIRQLDELVDNLLAYTLLIGDRYRMELTTVAMPRFLREQAAAWYAVFEQQGFVFEVKLEEMREPNWHIDRSWMKRILDNLLQNVLRHASQGKYVAIESVSCEDYDAIRIIDRGTGMSGMADQQWDQAGGVQQVGQSQHVGPAGGAQQVGQAQPQQAQGQPSLHDGAGSGIGLSIVDMMIKGMGLSWTTEHNPPYFIVEIRKQHR